MTAASFKAGDRVRVLRTTVVREGTQGTVQRPSITVANAYSVLFDGWPTSQLMHASDLERISPSNT